MKEFVIPDIEIIRINQKDIIVTSTCVCVDCTICPPGSNNCQCVDFVWSNQ